MSNLQEQEYEDDESAEGEIETEAPPKIYRITLKCTNCKTCQTLCPTDTIFFGSKHFVIDTDDCIGCEICVQVCTEDAIRAID
ncbi:4Fe-4S binding protein [Bdellovibrionota bacterium FG-2]